MVCSIASHTLLLGEWWLIRLSKRKLPRISIVGELIILLSKNVDTKNVISLQGAM